MGSNDMMMAFALETDEGEVFKNDPRYFRWIAAFYKQRNGVVEITYYPSHPCSDEEFG